MDKNKIKILGARTFLDSLDKKVKLKIFWQNCALSMKSIPP